MPFLINEAYLPATLTVRPMSDAEFSSFCAEHPDLEFEMSAEGELIVMAPTHSDSGASSLEVGGELRNWAKQDGRGIGCDSSTGYVLPNGARRSPDASWTLKSRVNELGPAKRKAFWHRCPDFVIELKSDTGRLKPLREKMLEYLEQGAQLGWLIDPENRTVEIFRPLGAPELRSNLDRLEGEGPVAGFVMELASAWDPFGD